MKILVCVSMLMLFLLPGCSSRQDAPVSSVPAIVDMPEFSKGFVPIGGNLSGTVTPSAISPGLFRWEVAATGNISHMGRVNAAITFPEVEVDLSTLTMVVHSGTWTGVLTAANGDQLFGTYTVRNGSTTVDVLGNVGFIADLEITGGTGRFLGATGSGITTGNGNIFLLTFSTSVQGTISRVGN